MNLVDTETGEVVGEVQAWLKSRLDEIEGTFDGQRPDMALALMDGNFRFTPHGLKVVGDPTFDDWMACGHTLRDIKQGLHFAIGDWLIYGRNRWPDRYAQGMAIFGFSYQTLSTDVWVAGKFPHSRRRELPHSYHREVSALSAEKQDEVLDKAEAEEWDRETIRAKVREIRNPEPRNRSRRIGQVELSCDLLYDEWSGKVAVEFRHTDGMISIYCPGWKSLCRLVRVIHDKGWSCCPLDCYGKIGWIAKR